MPVSELTQNEKDCALLKQAAQQASQIALEYFHKNSASGRIKTWIKGQNSPVSEADLEVDKYLQKTLLAKRPNYGWISEESKDERPAFKAKRSFVIDPIDGTRGFLNGSDIWCISLAIIEYNRPIIGVLICPKLGEFYSAIYQQGAYLNGALLSNNKRAVGDKFIFRAGQDAGNPSTIGETDSAGGASLANMKTMRDLAPITLHTSLSENIDMSAKKIAISAPMDVFKQIPSHLRSHMHLWKRLPSLAYCLALVAKGNLDVAITRGGSYDWDIAAIDVILQECDKNIVDLEGQKICYGQGDYRHKKLFASASIYEKKIRPFIK